MVKLICVGVECLRRSILTYDVYNLFNRQYMTPQDSKRAVGQTASAYAHNPWFRKSHGRHVIVQVSLGSPGLKCATSGYRTLARLRSNA